MTVLWPVASITFKEGIRNRAFYGIALLALVMMGANLIITSMVPRDVGKVAVDMALSTVSFSGLLLVLFIGINLIAKDLDRKTIYMVLSRPISRSQYIVGKFLGMVLILLASMMLLCVIALLPIFMLKNIYADYFQQFSWLLVFWALFLILLELILLTALSFLFASFASTSFISLSLTVLSYIIGQSLTDVKALVENPVSVGVTITSATVKTVQAAYYLFPNLSLFDIKMQAAHGISVPLSYLFWTTSYGLIYTCLAIGLAALIFRKKEFP
jgi:ABC-type transport system involved in multi-copper enzyme maturation permease subunit